MNQDLPSVRIFCVDHREKNTPSPPGVTVIGVGKNRRSGILHDNEGANIAHLNACLNEATAIWWVWQHPEERPTDYVGFCHYRRFLLFRPLRDRQGTFSSRLGSISLKPSLFPLLKHLPCGAKDASRIMAEDRGVSGVLPLGGWAREPGGLTQKLESDGVASAYWVHRALSLLAIHAPECTPYFEVAFKQQRSCPYNTFVVRTELFETMCAHLFPVILRLTEEWLKDPSPKISPREPGFITESLIGTYWRYLEESGGGAVSPLPMDFLPEKRARALVSSLRAPCLSRHAG